MREEKNETSFDQPEQNNPTPTQPKQNKTNLVLIALVGILAIAVVVLAVKNHNLSQDLTVSQTDYAISDSSRRSVEMDYRAALVRLDDLVSKNSQMDSIVSQRDGEISKLRRQIDAIVKNKNATTAELGKAKRLISRLNSTVQTYEERIALLESDNERLDKQNQVLTYERDSTVADNIDLQQKVRLGQVLHASNIRMEPINLKRGGKKEKTTVRANKVDILRITFDIDENRIATDGNKQIFIRITDPNGNLLSNAAYGSGVTETYDAQPLNFTLSKQFMLKQSAAVNDLVVDWNQDSDYAKGTYRIELYHQGHKIGSGDVKLK